MKLNLLTYNICHCADFFQPQENGKPKVDIERTAKVLADSDADIVGLNEVYERGSFAGLCNQTEKLAKLNKFGYYAFGEGKEFDWGDVIGNAVLSRFPIKSVKTYPVPAPQEKDRPKDQTDWYEDRVIVKATVNVWRDIDFISTHFGINECEQINMVKKLVNIIDNTKNPVVLCGDFNVLSTDAFVLKPIYDRLVSLSDVFGKTNEPTFESFNPRYAIDYIFVSKDFKPVSYEVLKDKVSDHYPVKVTVEID